MACWNLLDYDIRITPPWRAKDKEDPSLDKMINDINSWQAQWRGMCDTYSGDQKWKSHCRSVRQNMVIDFIHKTSQGERVGIQKYHNVHELIDTRLKSQESTEELGKRKTSTLSFQDEFETWNMFRAWQHLWKMTTQCSDEDPQNLGLIEVDECVRQLHKILLTDIDLRERTKAGQFSTECRVTTYKGQTHQYPHLETQEAAFNAVQLIADRYNGMMNQINNMQDSAEKVTLHYKCAAWLLFKLVSLHPFSDGNGRVCRLLCSYCLSVVTPFPIPVHSDFSGHPQEDYIDAIVKARSSESRHPVDLTCLLIESGWRAWEIFMGELNKLTEKEQ